VPFLPNAEGETPLDIAIAKMDHKLANSLVKLLTKSPMDHHARFVASLIPTMISMNIPALEKYFDKRLFQTKICTEINSGRIVIPDRQICRAVPTTLIGDSESYV